MSLQPLIPLLAALLAISAGVMVWAVHEQMRHVSILAASLFPLAVVAASFAINSPLWTGADKPHADEAVHVARRNARLMALLYAWAAIAMLSIYLLTALWWWHSWQYGSVMALTAGALLGYVHQMGDEDNMLRRPNMIVAVSGLAAVQAVAIFAGLIFLIQTGRLTSMKVDWPANHVFLTGGVGLMYVSMLAVYTQWRLRVRSRSCSESDASHLQR